MWGKRLSKDRFWLSADLRVHAGLVPLSGGKRTFELDVCFRADFVGFRPGSGRSRGPNRTSAFDPKRPFCSLWLMLPVARHIM